VKKLIERPSAPAQPKKKKTEEEEEFGDLWAEEGIKMNRNLAKFRNFTEKTRVKVNPVVVPMAGQSYNPSAKDHKEVIQKVIEEEKKEVEEVQRQLKTLKPYLFSETATATQAQALQPSLRDGLINQDAGIGSSSDEESDKGEDA
jgi:hypothetical protein